MSSASPRPLGLAHLEAERAEAERTLRDAPRALREVPGPATHLEWLAGRPRIVDPLRSFGELVVDVSGAVFRDPDAVEAGWSPAAELAAYQEGRYERALLLGEALPSPAKEAPPFPALPPREGEAPPGPAHVRALGPDDDPEAVLDAIVALEARVYEPARRDPREKLALALRDPAGVAVIAEQEGAVVGSALLAPLERVSGVDGVDDDPFRPRRDTAYTLAVTLDPVARGQGLGRRLKAAAVAAAAQLRWPDGSPRYRHVSGRNRVGHTPAMRRINAALGAYELARYEGQYGGEGVAAYYRMPTGGYVVEPRFTDVRAEWRFSDERLLAGVPRTWRRRYASGALAGVVANRDRLGGAFLHPGGVRAAESLRTLAPFDDASVAVASSVAEARAYLAAVGLEGGALRAAHREAVGVEASGDALLVDLGPAAGVPLVAALHRGAPAHDAAPRFDALALERAHHVAREAAPLDRDALGTELALAVAPLRAKGRGALRVVEDAAGLAAELGEATDDAGRLRLAPPLDAEEEELAVLHEAVARLRGRGTT
ncbi:MAG: GNAT family N-acetyltransferase [Myxococcota bacterium]